MKKNEIQLLKDQTSNPLSCGGCGYYCCGGSLAKGRNKLQSGCRRILLEEDNYNYNERRRKRVMTVYEVMKSMTGEMDPTSVF